MTSPCAGQLEPGVGSGDGADPVFAVEVVLERDPVLRRDGQQGILRAGCRRLLDHDTRLWPSRPWRFWDGHPGNDLPSPVSGWCTKWNWSVGPQMSVPAPLTVNDAVVSTTSSRRLSAFRYRFPATVREAVTHLSYVTV